MRFENSFGMTEDEYDKFLADTCKSIMHVALDLDDEEECRMSLEYSNGEVITQDFKRLTDAKSHFYCNILPKWESKDDIPSKVFFGHIHPYEVV